MPLPASATTSLQSFARRGGAQVFRDNSAYLAGILSRRGFFYKEEFEDRSKILNSEFIDKSVKRKDKTVKERKRE